MTERKNSEPTQMMEREITINNMRIHIRSIFNGQTSLEEALQKIVIRKLSEQKAERKIS